MPQGVSGAAIACSGHLRVRRADRLAGTGHQLPVRVVAPQRLKFFAAVAEEVELERAFVAREMYANEIGLRSGSEPDAAAEHGQGCT